MCGICSVGTGREWFRVHTGDGLESGAGRWSDSWDLSWQIPRIPPWLITVSDGGAGAQGHVGNSYYWVISAAKHRSLPPCCSGGDTTTTHDQESRRTAAAVRRVYCNRYIVSRLNETSSSLIRWLTNKLCLLLLQSQAASLSQFTGLSALQCEIVCIIVILSGGYWLADPR